MSKRGRDRRRGPQGRPGDPARGPAPFVGSGFPEPGADPSDPSDPSCPSDSSEAGPPWSHGGSGYGHDGTGSGFEHGRSGSDFEHGRFRSGRFDRWREDEPDPERPGARWRRRMRQAHNGWPPSAVITTTVIQMIATNVLSTHGRLLRPWDNVTTLLLLIGPILLFWRLRAPLTVFLLSSAASIVLLTQLAFHGVYAAAPFVALFALARTGRRQAALLGATFAWAAWLGMTMGLAGPLHLDPTVQPKTGQACLAAFGLGLVILLGGAARIRAENYAAQAKTRAEQTRRREEQEKRQASEERLRMAQELHDVLGHHLSLINVQAGVGLHLMDQRPEQAREALTAIKSASAEALREVRSVLGVLRTEGEAAPRQPVLGLKRLTELTASAGIPVRTTVTGEPRELPAEVDRAAYRIVQEALTNVRRHAGPQPEADVAVGYLPAALYLSIRNGGPAAAEPAPDPAADGDTGSGITGMRARAESLGGRLEAGRPPTGGFLVTVILPTRPAPATDDEHMAFSEGEK